MMEAVLWVHGSKCRVLLKKDGVVIDTNDMWNNRASAEAMIFQSVPEARLRFATGAEVEELNVEWDTAVRSGKPANHHPAPAGEENENNYPQ